MTLRSALAEAFWFVAYRSFIAAVIARVVLIIGVFVLAFGGHARAASASYENPMLVASDPYGIPFDRGDSVGITASIRRFGGTHA